MHAAHKLGITTLSLGLAVFAGYGLRVYAEGAPTQQPVFYAGMIEANGKPATGLHSIAMALYEAQAGGGPLCTSESTKVPVEAGRFRVEVSADCVASMRARGDVWAALKFTGPDGVPHELPERSKLGAVPYAMEAQHSVSASNADKASQCDAAGAGGKLASSLSELQGRVAALETFRKQVAESVAVTGDLSANNNTVDTCAWGDWADSVSNAADGAPFTCQDGRFVAGVQVKNSPLTNDSIDMVRVLCCEL